MEGQTIQIEILRNGTANEFSQLFDALRMLNEGLVRKQMRLPRNEGIPEDKELLVSEMEFHSPGFMSLVPDWSLFQWLMVIFGGIATAASALVIYDRLFKAQSGAATFDQNTTNIVHDIATMYGQATSAYEKRELLKALDNVLNFQYHHLTLADRQIIRATLELQRSQHDGLIRFEPPSDDDVNTEQDG